MKWWEEVTPEDVGNLIGFCFSTVKDQWDKEKKMPFMNWEKTSDGYKPVGITDEEMVAENARRRGKRAEVWLDEANEMVKREKEKKMCKSVEFKKENVFTAVNADELKPGNRVIVANTMAELRKYVKDGFIADVVTLKEVHGEDCLSRFIVNEGWFPLAYLVERAENCTNCGEGKWDAEHKKILCDPCGCGNGNVVFRNHEIEVCEYWKPKTEQKAEKHYRPFRDTDELVKVWDAKCPNKRPVGMTMPLIWVRDPKRPKVTYLLNGLMGNEVHWGSYIFNMQELFDNFEFLDGSPCGVEE